VDTHSWRNRSRRNRSQHGLSARSERDIDSLKGPACTKCSHLLMNHTAEGACAICRRSGRLELCAPIAVEPSQVYLERVAALENVVRHCARVSLSCAGIPAPTQQHFYASVLFTALCSRAMSLAILAPRSSLATKAVDFWDYTSLAILTRSLLELRLSFYYLCTEQCDPPEWECRLSLFNLHDCESRRLLFLSLPTEERDDPGFEEQLAELRDRLRHNSFFRALPEKRQGRMLTGRYAFLSSRQDIAVKAGVDESLYRWFYRFLSAHVHGLPLSFYRMGKQERGRGIYSETEESYCSILLSFSLTLLVRSRDEMEVLFTNAQLSS